MPIEREEERKKELETVNELAEFFDAPSDSAEVEIADLTQEYYLQVEANHHEFLQSQGKPYLGTRVTSKGLWETHCYSCKITLCNEFFKECNVCGWIICSYGACGCGYGLEEG